jgi:hypothetical protein
VVCREKPPAAGRVGAGAWKFARGDVDKVGDGEEYDAEKKGKKGGSSTYACDAQQEQEGAMTTLSHNVAGIHTRGEALNFGASRTLASNSPNQ